MKYRDIIQFEPIEEVIKFHQLKNDDFRHSLIRDFVFSVDYEKTIIPAICRDLDYTSSDETFGLQIVGDFGTGKSHLMSLFSLIAEDASLLPLVRSESAKKVLGVIAGKYKVIRFEMGSTDELWNIVCEQIDDAMSEWGISHSIAADDKGMYKDKLNRMMADFESAFPGKGLMIVIDEMLEYLKGRASDDRLNRDLSVLRALGEFSDRSKFRMVFGVQEQIYNVPQFQFAASMLQHANDRYRQIPITKQDVQYVVQERLLHKTDDQKQIIREHLSKFTTFFTKLGNNLNDYVNLFPVNPSYFDNFQSIRVGKSQREVMKTLSRNFREILDTDIPEGQPGLICYDHYWDDLNVPSMMTEPDVRRVSTIMETIHQKINENFTGNRQKNAGLAHRIANACAIKILQDTLEKTNGVSTENLIEDLCYLDSGCFDRSFLLDVIETTAKQIVTATDGQYFEKNDNTQEFHIRIEGGVNIGQIIKDYISTMSDDKKDQHFYNYLVEFLPIETDKKYRREFNIYRHRIDWISHKTMLDGYIFMGNPNERSTTQPQQNFYIYFMPIFNKTNIKYGAEPDSIYVRLDGVSNEMKELIEHYAAAEELAASVDSSQKHLFEPYVKNDEDKLKPVFQRDFMQCAEIYYLGDKQNITPQMMSGGSKEQVVSNIASTLLEDYFCQQMPNYPKFTLLRSSLTSENRSSILKAARMKIVNPGMPNRDGEAILAGLGLMQENQLSVDGSPYAISIMDMIDNKGEGQVLNRDEILHRFFKDWEHDWRTNDYNIDADFEFLVLSTMVAMGKIEIDLPGGKNINAANLKEIVDLPQETFYSFSHVRRPKGMNKEAVRELFLGILGKDMLSQLQNQEIYAQLLSKAREIAADAVKTGHEIVGGIFLDDIELLTSTEAMSIKNRLDALAGMCDKLPSYATPAKMRNIPWPADFIKETLSAAKKITDVRELMTFVNDFRSRLSYLSQAKQYMTDDEMKQKVDAALQKINDIIPVMKDDQKVNAFKLELDQLMGMYAVWYKDQYDRMHITGLQDADKRKIMNCNEKHVCDSICGADYDKGYFSVDSQYTEWCRKMSSLTVGSSTVNKESILRTPYQGFNPVQFVGRQLPQLSDLKAELEEIFNKVDETLHAILKDKELLKNKDILDSSELGLLDRFNNNGEDLRPENAERLVEIVGKLHTGIHKIPITIDNFRSVFNRPMTPEDAIKAFRKYIDSLTLGNKEDNVRIIFK